MTFEEFLAAGASAEVVTTIDGPALLLAGTVIQFKGTDNAWADYITRALKLAIPVQPAAEPNA